jgi:hypothetical protein
MLKPIVTTLDFGAETFGLAYLEQGDSALLVVGSNQDALIAAVESNHQDFAIELIESCLIQITGLAIFKPTDKYHILTGSWAKTFISVLGELMSNGLLPKLVAGDLAIPERVWCLTDDDCSAFFISFNNGSTKIMQLYSKQQKQLMLEEMSRAGAIPEAGMHIEQKVAASNIPDESDCPPNIWDGTAAQLLASMFVINGMNLDDKELPSYIPKREYPWKDNYRSN